MSGEGDRRAAGGKPHHDDGGVALRDVTFVVLDVETTGTAPGRCSVIEVGAARFRGGERVGTLQALVDPGTPIPPLVAQLTGIDDGLVAGAPPIAAVLPSLVDFVDGGVVVGHHVSFDRSFLDRELVRHGHPPLPRPALDTLGLSRQLLGDEVPGHGLAVLARHLCSRHRPRHRALDDALATADVFHALLERVATFGVTDIGSLVAFPGAVPREPDPGHEPRRLPAAGRR